MKKNIVIINRIGEKNYYDSEGRSFFPPELYNVFLITSKKRSANFPTNFYKEMIIFSGDNYDYIEKEVDKINSKYPLHYIVTVSEKFMELAGKLREKYNLYGMDLETANKFRNKILMKKILQSSQINVPAFSEIITKEIIEDFINKYKKIVIKEQNGMGSKNTYIINDKEKAWKALKEIEGELENYEIEEFQEGIMYHIDSLIENGTIVLCSVSKYLDSTLSYIENKPLISVMEDSEEIKNQLINFNKKVIEALKLKNGVTHHEVFYNEKNEKIIFCEIAARAGGCGIIPGIKNTYGINLHQNLMYSCINKPFEKKIKEGLLSGWIEFYGENKKIYSISCEKDFKESWIKYFKITKKKDDVIDNTVDMSDSIASFTFEGSSTAELIQRARALCNKFEVIYY